MFGGALDNLPQKAKENERGLVIALVLVVVLVLAYHYRTKLSTEVKKLTNGKEGYTNELLGGPSAESSYGVGNTQGGNNPNPAHGGGYDAGTSANVGPYGDVSPYDPTSSNFSGNGVSSCH